jgi:hypothetical protein
MGKAEEEQNLGHKHTYTFRANNFLCSRLQLWQLSEMFMQRVPNVAYRKSTRERTWGCSRSSYSDLKKAATLNPFLRFPCWFEVSEVSKAASSFFFTTFPAAPYNLIYHQQQHHLAVKKSGKSSIRSVLNCQEVYLNFFLGLYLFDVYLTTLSVSQTIQLK